MPRRFEQWNQEFLETVRATANISLSCRRVGISRKVAYSWKNKDSAKGRNFRREWEEAIDEAVDVLEAEARRRALTGVEKGVFHRGVEIATERRYSDTLLIFLLKAHRPDTYRETRHLEHSGPGGGPIRTVSEMTDTELHGMLGSDDTVTD